MSGDLPSHRGIRNRGGAGWACRRPRSKFTQQGGQATRNARCVGHARRHPPDAPLADGLHDRQRPPARFGSGGHLAAVAIVHVVGILVVQTAVAGAPENTLLLIAAIVSILMMMLGLGLATAGLTNSPEPPR